MSASPMMSQEEFDAALLALDSAEARKARKKDQVLRFLYFRFQRSMKEGDLDSSVAILGEIAVVEGLVP